MSARGPSAELLPFLAAWNLRTVVLHLDQMSASLRDRWRDVVAGGEAREVFRDGDTSVVELSVAPEPFRHSRARLAERAQVVAGKKQPLDVRFDPGDHPLPLPPADIGWHTDQGRWSDARGQTTSAWVRYYCPPAFDSRRADEPMFVIAPRAPGAYLLEVSGVCFDLSAPVEVR